MGKILLQGPNVPEFSNLKNINKVFLKNEIKEYLQKAHPAQEIFIYAHGGDCQIDLYTSKLYLELFEGSNQNRNIITHELSHDLLSKIIANTTEDKPNIVHIMSCHSGAAHTTLKFVEGNVILCTYALTEDTTTSKKLDELFNEMNNSKSLSEFIINNIPLLAYNDSTISYKLDNNIKTFDFSYQPTKTIDINDFTKFLQNKYYELKVFFKTNEKSYPELFFNSNLPEVKTFTNEELNIFFSPILNSYSDYYSIEKVSHLSDKMDESYIFDVILNKAGYINIILNKTSEINNLIRNILIKAIDKNQLSITPMLINIISNIKTANSKENYNIDKIKNFILLKATELGQLDEIKTQINKMEMVQDDTFTHILDTVSKEDATVIELIIPKVQYIDDNNFKKIFSHFQDKPKIIEEALSRVKITDNTFDVVSQNKELTNLLWNKFLERGMSLSSDIFKIIINSNDLELINNAISNIKKVTVRYLEAAITSSAKPEVKEEIISKLISYKNFDKSTISKYLLVAEEHDIELASEIIECFERIINDDFNNNKFEINPTNDLTSTETDTMSIIGSESATFVE